MASTLGFASIPFLACACLLGVMVLHVLAFASPHWASDENTDFGLWKYSKCIHNSPSTKVTQMNEGCNMFVRAADVDDWLNAVRGLESIAIIFWSIPIVVVPVYLYVALGLYYRCVMVSMTLFTLIATACNIAGVVLFGIKINDTSSWDMEWCIIVDAVAGALGIVAFIIFAVSCCNKPVFTSHTHLMSGFYVDPDRNRMYVVENVEEKPGPLEAGHVNPAVSN